jgi:sialic acid synthase SpsE
MKITSRKSLVVVRDVPLGATIRKEDVAMLRPGSGLSGPAVLAAIGARANRALVRGEELALDDFTPIADS